jgi:hypothetical protein
MARGCSVKNRWRFCALQAHLSRVQMLTLRVARTVNQQEE